MPVKSNRLFLIAMVLLFALTTSCSKDPVSPTIETPEVPQKLNDGWVVSSLEEQGMDPLRIGEASHEIRYGDFEEVHAMLIVRHGHLVFEEYYVNEPPHGPKELHNLNSVTKSITSVLVGAAVQQGYIEGYEQRIADFFPEHAAILSADPRKQNLRLWQVLTMTAGFEWAEGVGFQTDSDTYKMDHSSDPVKFVLEKPIIREPGTQFEYCDGLSMLLSGIIKNTTGLQADEFAEQALFGPLGITDYQWKKHQVSGLAEAHGGLRMRARDLAKIGYLYLKNGEWQGQQLVPAEWVTESTKDWISTDQFEHYGFQWWLRPLTGVEGYMSQLDDIYFGSGFGGQLLYIVPYLDLVVIFQGNCTINSDTASQYLVPRVILYDYIIKSVRD